MSSFQRLLNVAIGTDESVLFIEVSSIQSVRVLIEREGGERGGGGGGGGGIYDT